MNTSNYNIEPFAGGADDFQLMDLRRRILDALKTAGRYVANETAILQALRQQGHAVSVEKLPGWVKWLPVLRYHFYGDLCVAQLTDRGVAVADGTLVFPGIGVHNSKGQVVNQSCEQDDQVHNS